MTNHDDETTRETAKGQEKAIASTGEGQCDHDSRREGLAAIRGESQRDRADPDSANDSDLSRQHLAREDFLDDGGTTIGGIISQLRELQQEHLAYVKAHEDRLQKRLEENRAHQQNVLDKMEALEENAALYLAQLKSQKESINN